MPRPSSGALGRAVLRRAKVGGARPFHEGLPLWVGLRFTFPRRSVGRQGGREVLKTHRYFLPQRGGDLDDGILVTSVKLELFLAYQVALNFAFGLCDFSKLSDFAQLSVLDF